MESSKCRNNYQRESVRTHARTNNTVYTSLQSCLLKDNRVIHDNQLSKLDGKSQYSMNLCALRYILNCLLTKIPIPPAYYRDSVNSYIDFEEAFQIFLGFQAKSRPIDIKNERKHLRELLCHPVHGLCIYIIKTPEREVILLRPDEIDLERFFETFFLKEDKEDEVLNKDLLDKMFKSMDTEWDKKVLKVILGLSRSRAEIDKLGIDSDSIIQDRKSVFNFFKEVKNTKNYAEQIVFKNLNERKTKLVDKLSAEKKHFAVNKISWTRTQIESGKEGIEDLESRVEHVEQLLDHTIKGMINRTHKNIIKDRRLKLRTRGSGRKRLMDADDERTLEQCFIDKATAHGRRHDSVFYLNHRVKKKDFLKIVNHHRRQKNKTLLKSTTSIFNRSCPINKRSKQAKNHIGLGIFCCKKPPKTEDSSNLLTHFCRAYKKNIIRNFSTDQDVSNKTMYRSFDDKAYLCPATSTGMQSARSQKV